MARFVPKTAEARGRLELGGEGLELRFRPAVSDIITLAFTGVPVRTANRVADPGEQFPQFSVELYRPQETGRLPLSPSPNGYYYRMQPGDTLRAGEWICRLYLEDGRFEQVDAVLQVGYPSSRPLRVYPFSFAQLTQTVRLVLEGMDPKLTLRSGAAMAYQDGSPTAGPLDPGQHLDHRFRPEEVFRRTGPWQELLDTHNPDGTEAAGRLFDGETLEYRFRPAQAGELLLASSGVGLPGGGGGGHTPPGDDDPPGPETSDGSREVALWVPGESTPRQTWFHDSATIESFTFWVRESDLAAAGEWRLVLTCVNEGRGYFRVGQLTRLRQFLLEAGCGGFEWVRPHPGNPDEELPVLSRRLELLVPGKPSPAKTWSFSMSVLEFVELPIPEDWLAEAGDWTLRVTNTDAVNGTFNTGAAERRGACTLVTNKVHSNATETAYFKLPDLGPATLNNLRTLSVQSALRLSFANEPPPNAWVRDRFPLGYVQAELCTGHHRDALTLDLGMLGSLDVDIRNLWLRARVGFAIRDGQLDLGDVTLNAEIDLDCGLIGSALDLILGAISAFVGTPGSVDELLSSLAEQLVPRKIKDALRGAIGPVIAEFLPEGAKVLDAEADGELLRLYVWHPADQPDEPPAGRVVVPASPNLANIEHIVVVMMENRSFDHMLGYLRQRGLPVNGPKGDEHNELTLSEEDAGVYKDYRGQSFGVHRHTSPIAVVDPDHSSRSIARQIQGGMSGFVNEFVRRAIKEGETHDPPGWIMGYYDEAFVPVYDWIAHQFAICDQWHASLPGQTHCNRLYAFAGTSGGRLDNDPGMAHYPVRAVFEELDAEEIDWRFYYHNVPSLSLVSGYAARQDKVFPYNGVRGEAGDPGFAARAQADTLPPVTFIDPDLLGPPTPNHHNCDHPPSDIRCGQRVIAKIYNDLQAANILHKTLLVITYDEHGGFWDHVPPPPRAPDDYEATARYGVRVPGLLLSGRVANSVCHELFCHASIVKTILQRFCRDEGTGTIPDFGRRVTYANDLGLALMAEGVRPTPPIPAERIPSNCEPPRENPAKILAADDWRAWVAAAERPDPSVLSRPLAGLDLPWLAAEPGAPARMGRFVQERWPLSLLRVSVFRQAVELADPIPLYRDGAISPAFLEQLQAIARAAAAMSPPAWIQLALFERESVESPTLWPTGAPEVLRPIEGSRGERVRAWFRDEPGPRLDAQLALVHAVAAALADQPNVLWEICGTLAIEGSSFDPVEGRALAAWSHRVRAELRGVLGPRAFLSSGTGPWTRTPRSALSNEALLLGGDDQVAGLHPDFCTFEAAQWLRGAVPAQSVREAKDRAAAYSPGAPLVCRDRGIDLRKYPALADLAERAGVALRNGAGFLTRQSPESLGEGVRLALRRAVDGLNEPRRPFLVIYDLEREGREQYRALHAAIRAYDDALRLERSGWLIRSTRSLAEITADLLALVDPDDTLVVMPLDGVAMDGKAPEGAMRSWLGEKLGVALR